MRISRRYRRSGKPGEKPQNVSIVGKKKQRQKTGNLSRNRAQDSDPSYGANKRNEMAKKDLDCKKTFKRSKA